MSRPSKIAAAVFASAMLLTACADGAPEVADVASDAASAPAIAAPSPSASPSAAATTAPSPEPTAAALEPCPDGTFRVVPDMGECITPSAPEPEPEPAATKAPAPAATKKPEPEPEPKPEPKPAANPCDDRGATTHTITANNMPDRYDRSSIGDVCSGDTITLVVQSGSHSFTSNSAGTDTGIFGEAEGSRSATVNAAPGTYNYKCQLHGGMTGKMTVIG